jgi:hypothetical protein
VVGGVEVLGGVLVEGGIAAVDMAADPTEAEVDPPSAGLQAVFAAVCAEDDLPELVKMRAAVRHGCSFGLDRA